MNLPLTISLSLLACSLSALRGQTDLALPLPKYDPLLALQRTDSTTALAETTLVQNITPAAGPGARAGSAPSTSVDLSPRVDVSAPTPDASASQAALLAAANPGLENPAATPLPTLPSEGYWVDGAPINDVFQYLCRKAGYQYFFNNDLNGPEFIVTGHLQLDDPERQIEDLAVAFGLSVYRQAKTLYIMNDMQLARLPLEIMSYQLKYLRGSTPSRVASQSSSEAGGGEGGGSSAGMADFEKLKLIIRPLLTKSVGQIEFEEKTNTLLVTDNSVKIKRIKDLLERIDRPKPQIAVNVRVLRVLNSKGKRVGVDWSSTLGEGLTVNASQSLNAMFNLPDTSTLNKASATIREFTNGFDNTSTFTGSTGSLGVTDVSNITTGTGSITRSDSAERASTYNDGPGLVFAPLQVSAIIRALEDSGIVSQESCPTIITEDNEQGIISIVDRFPIITSTLTETTSGQNITDELRYKIDESDPDAMENPEKSREIGVTLSVTPTLLPDGTVRMKLRPRVAKIVEFVPGQTGNVYPRVSESTAEAISRIPAGQSLILGGFYDYSDSKNKNNVPLLGKVPGLGWLFKSKDNSMEKISLIFVITPSVYDASSPSGIRAMNQEMRTYSNIEPARLDAMSERFLPPLPITAPPAAFDSRSTTVRQQTVSKPSGAIPQESSEQQPQKRSWLKRMFNKNPNSAPSP